MTPMARADPPQERLLQHRRQDALPDAGLLGRPAADPDRRRRRGRHPLLPAVHRLPALRRGVRPRAGRLRPRPVPAHLMAAREPPRGGGRGGREVPSSAVVVGVVLGAIVGTVVFLIMIQGSFRQGYTDLDFNHVLGTMIRGSAEEDRRSEALGVVGDTAGPTGLYATLIGARRPDAAPRARDRAARAPALDGPGPGPRRRHGARGRGRVLRGRRRAARHPDRDLRGRRRRHHPTGHRPLLARLRPRRRALHSLAVSPGWWEVQEEDAAAEIERVAALEPSEPSLELAEQGPEQGRVGA